MVFESLSKCNAFYKENAIYQEAKDDLIETFTFLKKTLSEKKAVDEAICFVYTDDLETVSYTHLDVYKRQALGSLLGGGLAMFMLVPVFLALGHTSAAGQKPPELTSMFDMFGLLGRHLYGTTPTIRSGNLPNIYCGMLAVLLLDVYKRQSSWSRSRFLSSSLSFSNCCTLS